MTSENIGKENNTCAVNPRRDGTAFADAMPFDPAKLGKIGVCSIGKVGVITDIKLLPWGMSYVGVNVDTGESWASRAPVILANSLAEFISRKVFIAYTRGREGRPLH